MQILIVGAGASGLVAAIAAARAGAKVTILEHMKKPGRKLLLTGNGRCNLTNLDPALPLAYDLRCVNSTSQEETFAEQVIRQFSVQNTLDFFEEIGVACAPQADLIYPRSGQAQTVLDALLAELGRLRVKMKYHTQAEEISFSQNEGKWKVKTGDWYYEADRVILCCGGKAAPQSGSDGSGYALARMAGHHITAVLPALTAILSDDPGLALASGARTKSEVKLLPSTSAPIADRFVPVSIDTAAVSGESALKKSSSAIASASGEIQWTPTGLSGIVIFQLSRIVADIVKSGENLQAPGRQLFSSQISASRQSSDHTAKPAPSSFCLSVDLVPDRTEEQIADSLSRIFKHSGNTMTRKELLTSFTHDRVAAFLENRLRGVAVNAESEETALIARTLKDIRFSVTGLRDFDQAQVSCGGVSLDEVNPVTLESLLAPGLYFAGELLDIDGPCGGYNLQWAWSSGFVAGTNAGCPD